MKKMLFGLTLLGCLGASMAAAEDCTRFYDLVRRQVLVTCTPSKPIPSMTPGASALSATAPDLKFPPGALQARVEKVLDPATIQVTIDFAVYKIRLKDIVLPAKGTPQYRQAMAIVQTMAPTYSVLYFETSGQLDADRAQLGYIWQLSNQINLLLLEQGLVKLSPTAEGEYTETMEAAQKFAQSNKLGVWADLP